MLKNRVIPVLLLDGGGLVKTCQFSAPKYVGDPINAVRIFNEKQVDELIVLDIAASKNGSEPDYQMIEMIAEECFMPLCFGGGIQTLDQAATIFGMGVEKVCLQNAVFDNPNIINQIAGRFGSQSMVVSIDVQYNWRGKACLYRSSTGQKMKKEWGTHLTEVIAAGAGEVVLNAVDQDGTMQGPDLDIIREASLNSSVPLIALGGIGCLDDIKEAVEAGADAVAAGAFFVLHGPHRAVLITYPKYEELEDLLS